MYNEMMGMGEKNPKKYIYKKKQGKIPRLVLCKCAYVLSNRSIGLLISIPGRLIPKTQKIVLDASLLNTQHYKIHINGKVEQSREKSSAAPPPPPVHLGVVAIEKKAFRSPSSIIANFYFLLLSFNSNECA